MIRLCRTDDVVEGEPQLIETDGGLSLVVYAAQDNYYVTDAMCTHGMAALSDGYQEDFVIECPLHGGSFDIRSGEPLSAPCEIALKTYPVTLEDGWIAVAAEKGA
nr:non-heme iron oxygenase ferredoxin subunit [Sphingomonas sp. CDS-1]